MINAALVNFNKKFKGMEDYKRVASAIEYIKDNFKRQPSLEEVAEAVHLSPFHFQRMFKEWAGVSPKKFLQFVSLGHAKQLLLQQNSLLETSFETGLSGSSRLHDLFITIEGMTPGEFKNKGKDLVINYNITGSPFGQVLIATTAKGICHLSFLEEEEKAYSILKAAFPLAEIVKRTDEFQSDALLALHPGESDLKQVKLHLKGTPFQLKVWEALLKIPFGRTGTYSSIAQTIEHDKAIRAVGSAVGANPVAYLIPCHRVIRSTGVIGEYHWGSTRKTAILGWESCQLEE